MSGKNIYKLDVAFGVLVMYIGGTYAKGYPCIGGVVIAAGIISVIYNLDKLMEL